MAPPPLPLTPGYVPLNHQRYGEIIFEVCMLGGPLPPQWALLRCADSLKWKRVHRP